MLENEQCIFDGSQCSYYSENDVNGSCMYIECTDILTLTENDGFGRNWNKDTLIENGKKIFVSENNSSQSNPLQGGLCYFLYSPSDDSNVTHISVDRNGVDISTCGWGDLPCLSIYIGYLHSASMDVRVIELTKGNHTAEVNGTIFKEEEHVVILGSTGVFKEVSKIAERDGVFVVRQGNVTFNSITFILSTSIESELDCPLFYVLDGLLNLSAVNITSQNELITLSVNPVKIEGGNNSLLVSCIFENVSIGSVESVMGLEERKNEEDSELCDWNTGIVLIENAANVNVSDCLFNRTMNGAVVVNGSNVSLLNCTFRHTSSYLSNTI